MVVLFWQKSRELIDEHGGTEIASVVASLYPLLQGLCRMGRPRTSLYGPTPDVHRSIQKWGFAVGF
jgi:hypothetical protein